MRSARFVIVATLLGLGAAACAPAAPTAGPVRAREASVPPPRAPEQKTLVVINREEPPTVAAAPIVAFSGSLAHTENLFSATLDFMDEREVPQPYLAEAVPELNSDSWRVFPDGRMETVYRLRPNLIWHDGAALSAEDFAFALRVYANPDFGVARSAPIRFMEDVIASDPRTVVVKWKQLNADARVLDDGFQALPRHILEPLYREVSSEEFTNLPFWNHEYVGLGPYRVERWEPGVSIEGVAFDRHALGRPKIDRVRVVFIGDTNTALANMLAGDAHYIGPFILGPQEGTTLEQEWEYGKRGTVIFSTVQLRITQVQVRPGVADPPDLLDVRVRRALVHAMDAQGIVDALTEGKGLRTHSLTSPLVDYYAAIDQAIAKYPYVPRRAQQLLEEAGLRRGADGFFVSPAGGPFKLEIWHSASGRNDRENAVVVDSLRRAGVDATGRTYSRAQLRDAQARALTPGMYTGTVAASETRFDSFTSAAIPRADNRWFGQNRLGWSNAEYDRLYETFSTTLDRSQRIPLMAQLEKVFTEDVGAIPHYLAPLVRAHAAELKGPVGPTTPEAGGGMVKAWTWEWRS